MRYAVIMAGGMGKRLWPLSRQGQPKQLLPLFDGRSLLQLAFDRAARIIDPSQLLVCTGAAYADVVRTQLPALTPDNLLGEPTGRDSLNAAAWPAAVLARRDPDAVMAVLTADQLIEPDEVFGARLDEGFGLAEADPDALVTFGIEPTSAHTGYGYLERGAAVPGFPDAAAITAFHEKPDANTARTYLASGRFWWNSGMFVWRTATFLRQLSLLAPVTHQRVLELADHPDRLAEIYPGLARTSIDYAIMEPVSHGEGDAHVLAISLPVRWEDVGSFATLAAALPRDAAGNATQGDVVLADADGNIVLNTQASTVVAVLGVRGLAVVRTQTATLVAPLERAQEVKGLADRVASAFGEHLA